MNELNFEPMLVGVAGGSGGGKTTLAQALVEEANDVHGCETALILELDRFYRPKADAPHERVTNFDEPQALDFDLLSTTLANLISAGRVDIPIYDFARHDRIGSEMVASRPLIVVEGILALWHPATRSSLHYRVFVDAPEDLRLQRRIDRDVVHRGRRESEIRAQWNETVVPMHREYVEPTKVHADRIVDGQSNLQDVARSLLDTLDLP